MPLLIPPSVNRKTPLSFDSSRLHFIADAHHLVPTARRSQSSSGADATHPDARAISPHSFARTLKAALPMRLRLQGVAGMLREQVLQRQRESCTEDMLHLWQQWEEQMSKLETVRLAQMRRTLVCVGTAEPRCTLPCCTRFH